MSSNVILTRSCNKKCSYCFADTTSHDEMSLETFISILNKQENNEIKLLGGEPTQHSKFKDILNICEERNTHVTLISNFLFSQEIKEFIIKYINRGNKISFLINSTDLNFNNRMNIFRDNYNHIYEEMYNLDTETEMNCGITIDENKSIEEYIKYIDFLIENLIAIENMRLSLRFPGEKEENQFYFINNHSLGDKFVLILKKLMNENIPSNLDCIHFPCMYSSKEELKFVEKFMKNSNRFSCGESCPSDYLPNGKTLFCFPNSDISVNYDDFKTQTEIALKLKEEYYNKKNKITLPAECTVCHYRNICDGPCMGFFK